VTGDADDARARLRTLTDLATPWAIHVAATLRLADHIAAGATTADELARRANADADILTRLLHLLVAQGVFDSPRPGEVALNDTSRLLQDDAGWRQWLDLDGAPGIWAAAWPQLLTAVRTGEPEEGERTFQECLAAEPTRQDSFDELMAAQVVGTAAAVAVAYDWTAVGHVVDVGGGTGTLLRELLTAHKHLGGMLVELPVVAAKARLMFARAGVADRCQILEGSYFEVMPAGDVYCLSQILHGFPDEPAVRLLRRCADAGNSGRQILVLESLLNPEDPASAGFDLFMLMLSGGRQRTREEFAALAERAGLHLRWATPLASGTDLIVIS
jgi:2,7-dihydroxy-5-methyl-1-naphthoate 7-O-methyltransferase